MTRLYTILIAAVAVLAISLGASFWLRPASGLTEDQVRAIVADEIGNARATEQVASASAIDRATLDPMIESYLLANPSILEQMSVALSTARNAEETEKNRLAIASIHDEIFNDPDHVVIGNPQGDVTLVEMFDYNCSYCRTAVPDLAELIASDPNLRVVLKEFPILSQGSIDAARIALAVHRAGVDYWDFHLAMFSGRGQITGETALAEAVKLGLDAETISAEAKTPAIEQIIDKSYSIAQTLSISGTPTFIIGDEIVPGAVGLAALRTRIDNMRACGKTTCES